MALSVHLVKPVYKPARDYSLKAVREEVGRTLDIRTVVTDAGERGEEGEDHAEGGGQDEHVPAAFAPGSEVSAEPEPGAAVAVSSEEKAEESEIIEALKRHRLTAAIPIFVGGQVDAATVRELTKDEFGAWVSEVEFTTIQKKRLWKVFAELHAHDSIDSMSELASMEETKVAEIVAKKDSVIAAMDAELAALRAALSDAKSGISKPSEVESVATGIKATERRAVYGCPIFIEAIKEADFEKFKLHWSHRRELPPYAKFDGKNALHWAAHGNNVDVLQYLIADGSIDVNAICDYGWTALMYAARDGHSEAVRVLLTADNINVDAQSQFSKMDTALMQAALVGELSCVKLLVEVGGASLSIRNDDRETALDFSKKWKTSTCKETKTYLKSKAPKRKWF